MPTSLYLQLRRANIEAVILRNVNGDVGALIAPPGVVPVVIKSLLFA